MFLELFTETHVQAASEKEHDDDRDVNQVIHTHYSINFFYRETLPLDPAVWVIKTGPPGIKTVLKLLGTKWPFAATIL